MEGGQKNNDLQKSGSEILAILLSKLNLSAYQLALNCKYERPQAVYDVQNGKTKKISTAMARKIISAYPNVNIEFLLNGEGEVFKSNIISDPTTEYKKSFKNEVSIVPESSYQLVEFADLNSSAGELGGADISQLTEKHTRLIPKQYDNSLYLVIKISGESMNDGTSRALHDGDEVLVKLVEFGNGYVLPIRQKLFVITSSEGNVIKQITEINKDDGYIVCHSFNPAFDDYILNIKDIFQFFEVIMIINRPISLM